MNSSEASAPPTDFQGFTARREYFATPTYAKEFDPSRDHVYDELFANYEAARYRLPLPHPFAERSSTESDSNTVRGANAAAVVRETRASGGSSTQGGSTSRGNATVGEVREWGGYWTPRHSTSRDGANVNEARASGGSSTEKGSTSRRSALHAAHDLPEMVGIGRFRRAANASDAWLMQKLKEEQDDPTNPLRIPGIEKRLGHHPYSRGGTLGSISTRPMTISTSATPCTCAPDTCTTSCDEKTGSIIVRGFVTPNGAGSTPACLYHAHIDSIAASEQSKFVLPNYPAGKPEWYGLHAAMQERRRHKRRKMRKQCKVVVPKPGEDVENAIATDSENERE